ncbi:MAG: TetR/AcrR family transcriptional regulator [Caulobacter sp.]
MARPKAFDTDQALDAAIGVFREHGFEGASAGMLVGAMGIGRQSLYDTFGDKWDLYCSALRRYGDGEARAHLGTLRGEARAFDGLKAMVHRVVVNARTPCLGVGSIAEFGSSKEVLLKINTVAHGVITRAIIERIGEAKAQGDVAPDIDAAVAADFLIAAFSGIRLAARGGADDATLDGLGALALRALR